MHNYHDHGVSVGPAADDEMCNLYIMYWTSGDRLPKRKFCWSAGPPRYTLAGGGPGHTGAWQFGAGLVNVPPVEGAEGPK